MECKSCGAVLPPFPFSCKECGEGLCDLCAKSKKCKECAEKKPDMPTTWRRSWLTQYEKCPYSVYKMAIEGVKSDGNIWSYVGNILHDLYEEASKKPEQQNEEYLDQAYNEQLDKLLDERKDLFEHAQKLVKGDITKKMRTRGIESNRSYLEFERSAPTPLETEVKHFVNITDKFKVSATIDRVDPTPSGGVEIVDYKTGKCYYGKHLKNDLQAPLYILAYYQTTGVLADSFRFIFLEEGKERVFKRVDDDKYVCTVIKKEYVISLQETMRRVKTIFARAAAGEWGIPDSINSYHCSNFCDIAKQGHCAGKDEQQWNNFRKDVGL